MFGRQRRRRRQTELEATQSALEADAEARTALAEALARIDERLAHGLDEQARTQMVTGMTVEHLRSSVMDTRTDLAKAVDHLAQVCGVLSERIDAERRERQIFVEAISVLTRPAEPAIEAAPAAERVIGGSFPAVSAETIDVTEAEHRQSRWA